MKQLRLRLSVVFGVAAILLMPVTTFAETIAAANPQLIISEIKIKNDTGPGGYNEFIELYNAAATSLNLNRFTIEYYNSPAPAPDTLPIKQVVVADNLILPGQSMVFAANKEQIPNALDSPFSSLSDSGGLVRVKNTDGLLQDEVAWTSTSALAIAPVLLLSSSTTNKTKSFIRSNDDQGAPVLVNPQWQLLTPSPHADQLQPVPAPEPEPTPEPLPAPTPETPAEVTDSSSQPQTQSPAPEQPADMASTPPSSNTPVVPSLQISELLPNPAAPASDSTDEFVELYNPNDDAVDLNGYKLQTGNSYSYHYTFTSSTLQPHEYRAFYVTETNALLANSGGKARLLGPDGQIMYEAAAYDEAKEGMAWANVNGQWQWTTTPTPNAINILTLPLIKAAVVKSTTTTKAPAKLKTTAPKAAAAKKTTTAAKPKTTKSAADNTSNENQDPQAAANTIHPGIVAGVGALVLGYGVWEYQGDIRNRFYQLRRYRATRRAARLEA